MVGDKVESFELTFFTRKGRKNNCNISQIANMLNLFMGLKLSTETHLFEYEDNNYLEIEIAIYDFNITRKSFNSTVRKLTHFVEFVFKLLDSPTIATGIYELTYYYTEQINRFSEFNMEILDKFPLYFLHKSEADFGNKTNIVYESNDVVCFYNKDAQQIIQTDNTQ